MADTELEFESILKHMRELIGAQAQEIAVLKATIAAITQQPSESES